MAASKYPYACSSHPARQRINPAIHTITKTQFPILCIDTVCDSSIRTAIANFTFSAPVELEANFLFKLWHPDDLVSHQPFICSNAFQLTSFSMPTGSFNRTLVSILLKVTVTSSQV